MEYVAMYCAEQVFSAAVASQELFHPSWFLLLEFTLSPWEKSP